MPVPAGPSTLVDIDTVKAYLSILTTDTAKDAALIRAIGTATRIIEGEVGACISRTVTDTVDGHMNKTTIFPKVQPIISITSVTERGVTLTQDADFMLTAEGGLKRITGGGTQAFERGWWPGVNNVVITYVVGRTVITDNIVEAALVIIAANWRPERGGNINPYDDTPNSPYGADADEMRLGFYVPRGALERLKPDLDSFSGIA